MKDGGRNQVVWGTDVPSGVQGQSPGGGLAQSPQKLTTYYENNSQKHRLLVGQSKNNEIEGFGGRPPVGGRPGARGPRAPLNPALYFCSCWCWLNDKCHACGFVSALQSLKQLRSSIISRSSPTTKLTMRH